MKKLFILTFALMLVCTNGFAMKKLTSKGDKFDVANKINEIIDYINNKEYKLQRCEFYKSRWHDYVDFFNSEQENEDLQDHYLLMINLFKAEYKSCILQCIEFKN